ncbi:hypothetical protein LCGC14_0401590 [marine sediment metagenome]|uniref:Uncharacterized protein n=1 Tax=marine sediment metagenome TaxID=412755 RepID=A0A0F9VIM0_9ZZZZ
MAELFAEPHTVTQRRAAVARDADDNVAEQDFDGSPALDRQLECMVQTRGGDITTDNEGRIFELEGVIFTSESDVKVDDLFTVSETGLTGRFRAAAVAPKFDIDGVYLHTEVGLEKEIRR